MQVPGTQHTHDDIYEKQQATELRIEKLDGKMENMLQLLAIRNQQSTERHASMDRMIEELYRKSDTQAKDVWSRFGITDAAIEKVRELAEEKISTHRQDTDRKLDTIKTQLGKLDGKLLALGGGMTLLSFLLVLFAPLIQQQLLHKVPANGGPAHYELREPPDRIRE